MFCGWDMYDLVLTHLLSGWHMYDLDIRTCLSGWDLYDLNDLHMFAECDL